MGSFLNVCIARLPHHRSIAWPGSHCPRCAAPIRPWDNLPVLSYLWLRGRCRDCGQPISPRYPVVEIVTAAFFGLSSLWFPEPILACEAAVFCFLLLGLLVMDAETLTLPDTFTLPGLLLGIGQAALPPHGLSAALHLGSTFPFPSPSISPLASSLSGAVGAAALLLCIRWLYRLLRKQEGMGLGDVKLAAMLGAWLGITGCALTLMLGVLLAAVAGILILLRQRFISRLQASPSAMRLPFGGFLCAGAFVTLFEGDKILRWYFNFWH